MKTVQLDLKKFYPEVKFITNLLKSKGYKFLNISIVKDNETDADRTGIFFNLQKIETVGRGTFAVYAVGTYTDQEDNLVLKTNTIGDVQTALIIQSDSISSFYKELQSMEEAATENITLLF